MSEPVLVVAWLVLAHLIADFVLQNDWIAIGKSSAGRRGVEALLVHGAHVALCLVPAVVAFGAPGLLYLAVVAGSHMLVDRWKVRATKRAVQIGRARARQRAAAGSSGPAGPSPLGAAWTPLPGVLFLADQVFHLTIAIVAWLVILESATLIAPFTDAVNSVLRSWDRGVVHATVLTAVVLLSLLIVNTRAAFYFVLALTAPRDADPEPVDASPNAIDERPVGTPTPVAARAGTTIDALERLLVVALLLAGAQLVAGFLVLADTISRWRQLDDPALTEHRLLSSLASLAVAVGSALVAQAAFASLA
jgi:hypothetical protein